MDTLLESFCAWSGTRAGPCRSLMRTAAVNIEARLLELASGDHARSLTAVSKAVESSIGRDGRAWEARTV